VQAPEHAVDRVAARPALVATVALAVLAGLVAGCGGMWGAIGESQRQSSVSLSRDFVERGSCLRALESLERAQTRRDLGAFAAESVWLRARCLDALGHVEQALAHWRVLHDHYGETRWAARIPEQVAPRLGAPEHLRARPAPEAFEIPKPRYSAGAQRASIAGAVWVEYRLDEEGRPGEIRVIAPAHPLLVSYAVEAVEAGEWRESVGAATPLPRRAATHFRFESLWMEESDEGRDGSETGGDGEGAPDDGDEPRIEWFPGR